jgi:hypothetical protein
VDEESMMLAYGLLSCSQVSWRFNAEAFIQILPGRALLAVYHSSFVTEVPAAPFWTAIFSKSPKPSKHF